MYREGRATVSGRVGTVCTVPHANEGVTTPVKDLAKEDTCVHSIAQTTAPHECLEGLFFKHKRVVDICQAFERLRKCYPRRRLFVVLDNLHNVHDHPTV